MSNKEKLIAEATKRGIVEGATVKNQWVDAWVVGPISGWCFVDNDSEVYDTKPKGGAWLFYKNTWPTVITPAPAPSQGLEEGMATECSPAMRAAIIERAKELGLSDGFAGSYNMDKWITWCPDCGTCPIQSGKHGENIITPLDFLTRLEATAKKLPKRETINGHDVTFHKGSVYMPCSQYTNETVRAIAAKLQD